MKTSGRAPIGHAPAPFISPKRLGGSSRHVSSENADRQMMTAAHGASRSDYLLRDL
jgi:hypothetical protein